MHTIFSTRNRLHDYHEQYTNYSRPNEEDKKHINGILPHPPRERKRHSGTGLKEEYIDISN